jgi:hypothetical protein
VRKPKPQQQPPSNTLDQIEAEASRHIEQQLAVLKKLADACERHAIPLPGLVRAKEEHAYAALFLKRTLTDLRAVWKLLSLGYTSQGAAVASSLFEHSLAAILIVGGDKVTERIIEEMDTKEMGSPRIEELCRLYKTKTGTWPYPIYKWLCKMKHPTLATLRHEVRSSMSRGGEFGLGITPNRSPDDLGNKRFILGLCIGQTLEAMRAFADAGEMTPAAGPKSKAWIAETDVIAGNLEAEMDRGDAVLSFDLSKTAFGRRHKKKFAEEVPAVKTEAQPTPIEPETAPKKRSFRRRRR